MNSVMKPPDSDELFALWWLLGQTRDLLFRVRKRELAQYNILPRQSAALFIINLLGSKATPSGIARWLTRESHSTLGMLNRMEKQGLIKRMVTSGKKGPVRIILTSKGRKALSQANLRKSIHEVLSRLTPNQRKQLRTTLEILRNSALEKLESYHRPLFPR